MKLLDSLWLLLHDQGLAGRFQLLDTLVKDYRPAEVRLTNFLVSPDFLVVGRSHHGSLLASPLEFSFSRLVCPLEILLVNPLEFAVAE